MVPANVRTVEDSSGVTEGISLPQGLRFCLLQFRIKASRGSSSNLRLILTTAAISQQKFSSDEYE